MKFDTCCMCVCYCNARVRAVSTSEMAHMNGSSWGTLHFAWTIPFQHVMSGIPWCSTCGKEVALPCSMKVPGCARWWYFCDQCSKDFCLVGGEGVKFGPVCRGWGWDRSDPIAKVNDVACTDINMDDLWAAQTPSVCLHAAYFEMPSSGQFQVKHLSSMSLSTKKNHMIYIDSTPTTPHPQNK